MRLTSRMIVVVTAASVVAVVSAVEIPARPPGLEGVIGFLLSPRGKTVLLASSHSMAQALRERAGLTAAAGPVTDEAAQPAADTAAQSPCGSAAGTRFNLEARTPPGALPQNETSVDFLPGAGVGGDDLVVGVASDFRGFFNGLGNSATGYYVHRGGATASACGADFEGGLPALPDGTTGRNLPGGGDAATEADAARGAFFVADNRLIPAVSAIGLFRTTVATLLDTTACPAGTHSPAAARTCWPVGVEVSPNTVGGLLVKPHLAVDPRATGAGAGDVYVSAVLSDLGGTHPILSACKNDLSSCSAAVRLSSTDTAARSLHVRVRPNVGRNLSGAVTVTYVNTRDSGPPNFLPIFDLKYVTCTPQAAPNPPLCSSPTLVATETQPVGGTAGLGGGSLPAAQFMIATYPKHEHRVDANGVETYIVWDRCQVPVPASTAVCPDAGIAMAASTDNGSTWKFGMVEKSAGDQYFPWIRTDSTNTVNIVYYSAGDDAGDHRAKVILRQIAPGAATPDAVSAPVTLTSVGNEPSGDFFLGGSYIGSNIGVAARSTATGRRAYVHFMHSAVPGVYNGAPAPEQNNHLARFDY